MSSTNTANTSFLQQLKTASWDRLGMALSFICAIHCLLTPFVILSVPMLARYYLVHPLFHWFMALLIVPVGVLSFLHGYRHHRQAIVFYLGLPGLIVISFAPIFAHNLWREALSVYFEPLAMTIGSLLLISAHWFNRRGCRDCHHNH